MSWLSYSQALYRIIRTLRDLFLLILRQRGGRSSRDLGAYV